LPAAASKSAPAQQAYGFSGTKAVVIDNDASVLEAMRPLLDRWGCEARFILGLAGIEALMEREPDFCPDFILADFHLDFGASGLTAVATLRAHWGSEIAAIVITADHAQEVTEHVLAAGCEILRKPVKPAELRALMMHLLGQAQAKAYPSASDWLRRF
jgi:CheY-like chemotaxis protein